jgi:uncharacterized protein (TIGR00304 family)
MNKFHFLSLLCFIAGISFFLLGFLHGDVESGFFIIFPFISGSGIYAAIGFILIFIAILAFMFGFTSSYEPYESTDENHEDKPRKKTSVKGGGVVLIGPIPIVFGSNWKIAAIMMIIAIILILVSCFFFRNI